MKRKRRPWLRRIIWTGTGILVLLVALYSYVTRPAQLRARLLQAFATLPVEVIDLGLVTFSLRDGLELVDLDLALPGQQSSSPTESGERFGTRLHVAHARIRCDRSAFLRGQVQPREILLDGVELTVVCSSHADADQPVWSTPGGESRWTLPSTLASTLPLVVLERADVRLLVSEPDGRRLVRHWLLSGTGTPHQASYQVRLEWPGNRDKPLLELEWDQSEATLAAAADWLDLEIVALFLPRAWVTTWTDLNLRGRVCAERMVFTMLPASPSAAEMDNKHPPLRLSSAELRLADLHCSLPIEEDPESPASEVLPASQRFAQISGTEAVIRFDEQADGSGLLTIKGTGELNGAPTKFDLTAKPALSGTFSVKPEDLIEAHLRVDGLSFPTMEEHREFVTSRRLPRGLRNFFNDFRPKGPANLRLWAARDEQLRVEGELEALGIQCRYNRFPYDFTDVRGRVRFSQAGIFLEDIRAHHGSACIHARGFVNRAQRETGLDLTFHGTNIPMDGELFAALPPKYQSLWRRVAPLGVCAASVKVQREDSPSETVDLPPTEVHVDTRLFGASLLIDADRRLQQVDGTFTIAEGLVAIHDLHGELDGAEIRLLGTLSVDDSRGLTDLRYEVTDVPVSRITTVKTQPDQPAGKIHFAGRADVWGHLCSNGPSGERETSYTVHIKDGELTGFNPEETWQQCEGWISVTGDRQEIHNFSARQTNSQLNVTGTLPVGDDSDSPVSLIISITNAPMDALPRQLVPPQWHQNVEALGLAGPGEITLQLRSEKIDGKAEQHAAEIELSAERMRPTPLPLDLEQVEAHATVTGEGLEIHDARGRLGPDGRVQIEYGRMGWKDGQRTADFGVSARDVDISPELIEAMPEALARLLKRLEPSGRLQAELDRVQLTNEDGETWLFTGRLVLESAELNLGLPLTEFNGQIDGSCTAQPDGGVVLQATISLDHGRLAGRPIENWEGVLRHQPGDPWVRLEDLHGRLCGGDALGFVHVDPATSAYELSLTLQNVNFAQFMPRPPESDQPPRRGQVDGNVFLRGTAGKITSRNGGGDLRIRGASFLQTPVLAKVTEAKRQADQDFSDTLDLAELRFVWQGNELRFTRVDVQSRDLRMVGQGTWNMETDQIELTLVGAHPRHWPRIAILTDLLETTGRELVQYHVHGTANAPQVTAEPLYRLNKTLRALLTGGE